MKRKLIITTLLSSSLVLNMSFAVLAAPASSNTVVTGRTEQNRVTGIIMPAAIQTTAFHNVTKAVTFTGTVVIDGPQLVFTVTDPAGQTIPANNVSVTKVADKTYNYSVTVDPSRFKGNVDYTFSAKTIYINGKTAGQTHTAAPDQKQVLHVAYVSGFEYGNLTWGTYDRSKNQYPFSYDFAKVWDDGKRDITSITGIIDGKKSLSIQGSDATYDGGTTTVGTEMPPVNIYSFEAKQDAVWTFNKESKKYDLEFTLVKNLSNGNREEQQAVMKGVAASTACTYTAKDERSTDYSQDFTFTAPAPAAVDVLVSNISSKWTGNEANGGNVQEKFTLIYTIEGETFTVSLNKNFTKNNTGFAGQDLTFDADFYGQIVPVNYTLKYVEPASTEVNTSNSNSTASGTSSSSTDNSADSSNANGKGMGNDK